jgi:hypothetical protein
MSFLVIPSRHSDFGFSIIIVSIILMGELSVAVLARPAFAQHFIDFWNGFDYFVLYLKDTFGFFIGNIRQCNGHEKVWIVHPKWWHEFTEPRLIINGTLTDKCKQIHHQWWSSSISYKLG